MNSSAITIIMVVDMRQQCHSTLQLTMKAEMGWHAAKQERTWIQCGGRWSI